MGEEIFEQRYPVGILTNQFRIFATCDIGEALDLLRKRGYQVEVYPDPKAPPKSLIIEKVRSGTDGLITTLRDQIDAEVFSAGPAKAFGLPGGTLARGSPGNVTLFDPEARWKVEPSRFESLSRNTPFAGWELVGRPVTTIVEGRVVWSTLEGREARVER